MCGSRASKTHGIATCSYCVRLHSFLLRNNVTRPSWISKEGMLYASHRASSLRVLPPPPKRMKFFRGMRSIYFQLPEHEIERFGDTLVESKPAAIFHSNRLKMKFAVHLG